MCVCARAFDENVCYLPIVTCNLREYLYLRQPYPKTFISCTCLNSNWFGCMSAPHTYTLASVYSNTTIRQYLFRFDFDITHFVLRLKCVILRSIPHPSNIGIYISLRISTLQTISGSAIRWFVIYIESVQRLRLPLTTIRVDFSNFVYMKIVGWDVQGRMEQVRTVFRADNIRDEKNVSEK